MDYARFVRFGENRKGDISLFLENKKAFKKAIGELVKPFRNEGIDKVAGIEARGFVFAGAMACLLKAGVVLVRKGGTLPCQVLREEFVDYTNTRKSLEIARDAIKKGERVLVVDDWLETGFQAKTTCAMIEKLGGIVVGIAVFIDDTSEGAQEFLSRYSYYYLVRLEK